MVTALAAERILLLSRNGGQFSVLGESGTVYAVSISTTPTCDCPSFARRFSRGAKHLAFVLVKVLGVPPKSYILHQTALLSWEVRYWLGRTQQGALAPLGVREASLKWYFSKTKLSPPPLHSHPMVLVHQLGPAIVRQLGLLLLPHALVHPQLKHALEAQRLHLRRRGRRSRCRFGGLRRGRRHRCT